jgi:phosphoglycolate phosphatase-like HAD superfamily hydrolase
MMTVFTRGPGLTLVAMATAAAASASAVFGVRQSRPDPLPSWNAGSARSALVTFVDRVTQAGSPEFVAPAERIAVFDNDGTLWAEQPAYFQLLFAIDRVRALAPQHPEWKTREPFASALKGDVAAALKGGERAVMELLAASHAGISTDAFQVVVEEWLRTARHPASHRHYTEMVYQPMLEVLNYLRVNGFKTFIVSGGGVEFIRAFADDTYRIPPEQVVGSSVVATFVTSAHTPQLIKQPHVEFIDDGPGKPVGINRFIGRRPIAAFGNSDGDLQMLQWTAAGAGARFCLFVHHTDAAREWAYDRASHIGRLDKGLDEARARGWTIVDMKTDWKTVFLPR